MTAPDPHVHPAWYGAVMGTGALALALAAQSDAWGWDWLDAIAVAMLIVASIMAIVLLPRYLRRLSDRGSLAREIANPAQGPMLATLPAGLLVLASGWGRIGPSFVPTTAALWVDAVLLVIGALLGLALSVIWSASLLQSTPGLEGVNGGWLVPPVMTLLVPLGLAPLIVANPDSAPLLLLIGFAFFGIGTVLFLSMLTLLVARLALRDPLPPAMAPSMWIPLAPAGMIGLALIRLLQAGTQAGVRDFHGVGGGLIIAAMGIGFGLWWAAFAALELRRTVRSTGAPATPGWWAFVFPIASLTLSIAAVGAVTEVRGVELLGLLATVLLTVVWTYVLMRTVRMLLPGRTPPREVTR